MAKLHFYNTNATEWMFVKEFIEHHEDECEFRDGGFAELSVTKVKLPNGDMFKIEDFDGMFAHITKMDPADFF